MTRPNIAAMTFNGAEQQVPLTFTVTGVPVQQGSKTAFVRGARAVVTDQNAKRLKPWRARVAETAEIAALVYDQFTGPLAITLDFYMPRGATVKRARPEVTPDLDKLVRAILDGITDSGAWRDDAQVVDLHAREWYADGRDAGVDIRIAPADNVSAEVAA